MTAADELSDVLERLRWSVADHRADVLPAGERHRITGDRMRFHFVARGRVDVRSRGGKPADPDLALRAGDFALLPRGGDHTLIARADAVLHTGEFDAASPVTDRVVANRPRDVIGIRAHGVGSR